jgi:hypothetical protein
MKYSTSIKARNRTALITQDEITYHGTFRSIRLTDLLARALELYNVARGPGIHDLLLDCVEEGRPHTRGDVPGCPNGCECEDCENWDEANRLLNEATAIEAREAELIAEIEGK